MERSDFHCSDGIQTKSQFTDVLPSEIICLAILENGLSGSLALLNGQLRPMSEARDLVPVSEVTTHFRKSSVAF